MSSMVEKSIDVNLPIRTVYDQWTQFEEFPLFMEGVKEVRQLGDNRLHWVAEIAGKTKEWEALILEQKPDLLISWKSTSGAENSGHVTFTTVGDATRVTARMVYDTDNWVEAVGDALGMVDRRVQGDLERFKHFIETRGVETGAWRGEIHQGHVERAETPSSASPTTAAGFGAATPTTGISSSGSPSSIRSGRADSRQ
jgi:uncharacterized membrane protein